MSRALKFPGIRVELRRPTANLACARAILDLDEIKIKALSDQGVFPTWNIARATDPASHSERRFLTRALRDFAEGRPITRDQDFIVTLLYGQWKIGISGKDFCRAWNCDSGHMINLVRDGTLQLVEGSDYGRGRGRSPEIAWGSAVNFLRERRVG